MGMTIEEHKEHLLDIMDSMSDDACGDWRDSLAYAIETMRKYQKIQADYNARLKADMVAMLDKIRAEIEQNAYPIVHGVNNHELGMTLYGILQIIDKHKAESEG